MEKQDSFEATDPGRVVEILAVRCRDRRQFERVLAFALAGDRLDYPAPTWYRIRAELDEVAPELADAA